MFTYQQYGWCFLFLTCFAGCRQPGKQQEGFYFNPVPGTIYQLSVSEQDTARWNYNGKPQQATSSRQTAYHFQLVRKTDTAFLLKFSFDQFRIQNNMYTVNTLYANSAHADIHDKPLLFWNYLLHFAKGLYVTVWVNRKGRPIRVNGIDRLIDSIAILSGESNREIKYVLHDIISEPAVTDELSRLFYFLPDRPKIPGRRWVENIVLVTKAPVKWSTDFTLQSFIRDTAFISSSAFVSARQGGNGRTYMKGKLEGSIVADRYTGIPYQWNAESETVTITDAYEIVNRQLLTATITSVPAGQ